MISPSFLERATLDATAMRERFFQGHFNILGMASLGFAIDQLRNNNFQELIKKKTELGLKAKKQLTDEGFLPTWVAARPNHSTIFSINGGEELHDFDFVAPDPAGLLYDQVMLALDKLSVRRVHDDGGQGIADDGQCRQTNKAKEKFLYNHNFFAALGHRAGLLLISEG